MRQSLNRPVCRPWPLVAALVTCGSAWAQVDASKPNPAETLDVAESKRLETVTITAQRRREPAREVPLTTNVVSAETLERGGSQSLRDLTALLPGVTFSQTGGGGGQSEVTMRGVSTGAQVGATVSMYIDDVPFGSSSAFAGGSSNALDLGLFDLTRIEVLRGPQGTLYGAGAMGGLIKYVTLDPDPTGFSGLAATDVSSTQGGGTQYTLRGAVNVPLSEGTTALRATVYRRTDEGFIHDPSRGGGRVDGSQTEGARVSLLVAPQREVNLRLTAMTQRHSRDGTSAEDVDIATGQASRGARTQTRFDGEPFDVNYDLASASLDWDMTWARLQLISGWQRSQSDGRLDVSPLYAPLLAGAGIVNAGYRLDYTFGVRKTTQEVRLTSASSRRLEWLAGLYYTDETGDRTQALIPQDAQRQPVALNLLTADFPSRFRELAAYGTVTTYLSEQADLTLGARHSRNRQRSQQFITGAFAPPQAPDADAQEAVTTWLITGRYRLSPEHAVYARAASGYRPGGPLPVFTNPVNGEPLTTGSFKSDSLWSYELGWKGEMLDRRLAIEAAIYRIDWKNIQVFTAQAGFSTIGNAGSAVSRGLELTLRAKASAALSVSGALSLIDAKLREDNPALGAAAGDRVPDTARVSAAFLTDYSFDWGGRASYAGVTLRYTGERFNTFKANPNQPQYRLPAFATVDLRAGTQLGKVALGAYVRNLANARGQTSADTTLASLGGPARVSLVTPRTVGIQVSTEF